MKKVLKLLMDHRKLIKIADLSEHGWRVVSEYTADELAEDSDNKNRLEKAERAAERKARNIKADRKQRQRPPQPSSSFPL